MKSSLFFLLFLLLMVFALVAEEFLAPFFAFCHVSPFLLPVVFCFGSFLFRFPVALFFGAVTGLLVWLSLPLGGSSEVGLGWSLAFFILWAGAIQFFCFFAGVRWEVHTLTAVGCTATFLGLEWVLVSLARGSFFWSSEVAAFILVPAGMVALLAPFFYGVAQCLLPPIAEEAQ